MAKILVVDDDLYIQKLYKEEFEGEGYGVVVAGTGVKAMELFFSENPDLAMLDILMPDIDGLKLLYEMKGKKPRLPIIMSTAYDYRDDFAVHASEEYIIKSSDLTKLKEAVKKLLKKGGI
ncbi:response regulator [Candidatus Falkowbacteria bacterium]|nr:response regulator [Candidatus Falkowbacteria bacterium]